MDPLGTLLGLSWAPLGLSWAPLGLSWGLPGILWDPPGRNFGVQDPLQERLASSFFTTIAQEGSRDPPGTLPETILGPSRDDFGTILG